jgi:hypothetical protein
MGNGLWFKSTLFEIEPGEDDEINPGIYGRQVSTWLRQQLDSRGYATEDIIHEDWGRCLMLQRSPFALWVGVSSEGEGDDLSWHCFAVTEGGLKMRLFGKKNEIEITREKLAASLREILESETAIRLVLAP